MPTNNKRILGDVLRMDGWIATFTKAGTATVHLDCVFRTAHLGDGPDDEITVRFALRRAEIFLRTMEGDPFAIVKGSQWAEAPSPIKVQTTSQRQQIKSGKVSIRGTLSGAGVRVGANAAEKDGKTRVEKSTQLPAKVQHLPDAGDGKGPGFEVSTTTEDGILDGHAWHSKQALLQIKRLTDQPEQAQMLVTVRCRYPDLAIDPSPTKEKHLLDFLKKKKKDPRLVAAEQYLKEELVKLGFLTRSDELAGCFEFEIGTMTISEGTI